ncbi:MAG TPA: EamA family transporter [Chthoniobacterales bacterium]|nr:EamA family transporter [Chthoniobacterales bacterium]
MKILPLFLILLALTAFVSGQLLFKHAMTTSHKGFDRNFARFFVPAIGCMTVSFFLTLGLLQRFDLSYVYPFQGLSVIFVSLLGGIVLKERLTIRLLVGALIISAGVVLVSIS